MSIERLWNKGQITLEYNKDPIEEDYSFYS